nr:AAA domain-containing protein [Nocardia sp. GTS18]
MVKSGETGAIVRDGDDCFLPLPLNSVQLQILEHVDSHAHTIVQGPPGTGKTHTAAALITHLLAQGKRVLVTAHTDRALEEVRGKLREEMQGLCVSVAGASRDNFDDLKRAMERIAHEADRHDSHRAQATVKAAQARVADLCAARTDIRKQLLQLREAEVVQHQCGSYEGTLTELVTRHRSEVQRFDWISTLDPAEPGTVLPVSAAEVAQWRSLLLDSSLEDPEAKAPDLITTHDVPPLDQIALWSERLQKAESRVRSCSEQGSPQWIERIVALNPPTRSELQAMVQRLDRELGDLATSPDAWVRDALADISRGRAGLWQDRAMRLAGLTQPAMQLVAQVGISQVRVTGGDTAALVALAEAVRAHIEAAGPLKVGADGMPKIGFALGKSRVLKDAAPLFEHVRVDGRIPTTSEQLGVFLHFEAIERLLGQLDEVWVGTSATPVTGSPTIRLTWHREHAEQLKRLLSCGSELSEAGRQLRTFGIPEPDWSDVKARKTIFASFDAVTSIDERQAVQHLFETVCAKLNALRYQPHATANLQELYIAVERGDVEAYRRAYQRLGELNMLRRKFVQLHETGARMALLPRLRDAVTATASDPVWDDRLADLESAWEWAGLGRWLASHEDDTVNELFSRLDDIESSLRNEASELAVTKAWDYAVGPDRLTANTRVDLRQYAQLVRRLGKGTGAHADRRRAEIRATLARCRSAVPVWIMPIYRVVEQLDIEQDMFDVVVVDEASQAGVEAVFLQYLAPRIVVIGDNRQVSPSGVGVRIDTVNGLGEQYLSDNLHRATWTDPKRSLFDEAAMRFPSRLTLLEHRRCVPEIIGFSNKIAYEKDDVRLVPVRLYGADRLPPIRTEYVADGVSTPGNVNDVEADRVVARILACLADSHYDGKTFGVISLLGTAQAEVIWKKLLVKVPPEEIARRKLRCGDAADFQGAERDVMFLSLVKSAGPESRLVARADESATQRYNVAVSRAADQLWLFHSVTAEQLKNPADLRYQLLDYCRTIETAPREVTSGVSKPVPEDRPVSPFRSLFEQHVFNRIVDRGYRVVAQYDVGGHALDMVIIGGNIRVAVQCDGDKWAGPSEYQRSMAWQRDLQRCGWPFFRIRQSRFVSDPEASLAPLWELLREVGLKPVSAENIVEPEVAPSVPVADPLADFDWSKPEPGHRADETEQTSPRDAADADVRFDTPHSLSVPSVQVETAGAQDYSAFSGLVSPVSPATPVDTIVDDLLRVVEVEGPVTAGRLRSVFFRNTSDGDASDRSAALDRALLAAVQRGVLIVDDFLELPQPQWFTYRSPTQPETRRRTLGARSIEEIPPRELAQILADSADSTGWDDRRALMQRAASDLGQQQLTDRAISMFALVLSSVRPTPAAAG